MADTKLTRKVRAILRLAIISAVPLAAQACGPDPDAARPSAWRLHEETDRFTERHSCGVLGSSPNAGVEQVYYFYYPPSEAYPESYKVAWRFDSIRGLQLDSAIDEVQERCRQLVTEEYLRSIMCDSSGRLELLAKVDDGVTIDTRKDQTSIVDSPSWQYDQFDRKEKFIASLDVTSAVNSGASSITIDYRIFAWVAPIGDSAPPISVDVFDDVQVFEELQEGARMARECNETEKERNAAAPLP